MERTIYMNMKEPRLLQATSYYLKIIKFFKEFLEKR